MPQSSLSADVVASLRCPACGAPLASRPDGFACTGAACGREYPVVQGVPVLVDESRSLLRIADYRDRERVLVADGDARRSGWRALAARLYGMIPDVADNPASSANYARFASALAARGGAPRVLVVGGREVGQGMQALLETRGIELVETDIDFGPRTRLVCDAHQLPFADGSFDGLVIQAVLEHVLDPWACVEEIHRVLRPDGLVYAETPFLYRRHGGPFDFTRFTFLGHRRLFRRFREEAAGAAVGPGVALALGYTGFLLALSRRRAVRAFLRVFGRLTSFWLKYVDRALLRNDAALDAAAGFYFLGRRSEETLPDRELIRQFRGMR